MITSSLMFASRMLEETDLLTSNPAEIDVPRLEADPVMLELAEVLSGVATLYEINLPDRDMVLLPVLRKYGRRASELSRGVVGFTAEGVPGLGVGRGSIESDGEDLVHLTVVPAGRYVEFWTIPDVTYWGVRTA